MMIEKIGSAAMLEQLAEESTELAQAALKMARILRRENPTPADPMKVKQNLNEEFTDVCQCACELDLNFDLAQAQEKEFRFMKRWMLHERKDT